MISVNTIKNLKYKELEKEIDEVLLKKEYKKYIIKNNELDLALESGLFKNYEKNGWKITIEKTEYNQSIVIFSY